MKRISWNRANKIAIVFTIIGSVFTFLECTGLTHIISENKKDTNQLTIFVTDTLGNAVLENQGRLNIPLGNRSLNEVIGVNGRTNFPDITANNLGETLKIGLDAEGWEIVDRNEIHVFNGEPITITVRRDQSLGIIKGVVMSRNGQHFIPDAEIYIGADTLIYSNSRGQFKTVLPNPIRVSKMSDLYKLTIHKQGFKTKTEICHPDSFTEVRLEPN